MKTHRVSARTLVRSVLAPALIGGAILPSTLVRADAVAWDGGPGGTGTTFDTAGNWSGDVLPGASSEALFGSPFSYPSVLTTSTTQSWGGIVWNSSQSGVSLALGGTTSGRTLALTGGSDSAAAIAAGGVAGDVLLLGTNFTSGTFTINGTDGTTGGGRLTLSLPNTTGDYSINVVNAGATLDLRATTNGATAADTTITKTGAGTLTFNNGNISMFGGGATGRKFVLAQGTLNVAANANLGGSTFEIRDGVALGNSGAGVATLTSNVQSWTGDFSFAGANGLNLGTGASAITLSGTGSARTVTVGSSVLTVAGAIGGAGYGLVKEGSGTLVLSGANTYDGPTTVNAGTLALSGGANRLNTATSLVVNGGASAGGLFDLGGQNQTIAQLSGGSGAVKGIVQNNSANSTATLTITGTSQFDGTLRNGASAPSTRILALAKTTGGTLRLTGSNTYTGGTTIGGGALLANNASGSATGTGAITVNGGFLGGTGAVSGAITLNAGGAISPGDSGAGIFSGGSSLTWNSDGAFSGMVFDLGADQASSDQLSLAGAFTKGTGSVFIFDFVDSGHAASFTYSLVNFGSTTFTAGDFAASGIDGSFAIVGNTLQFTTAASAIPEPSAAATLLGALALGGALSGRRRR